jgi:uncharacterized protein YciI
VARWAAIFEDNPEAPNVRQAQRDAHFAYLARHADRILLAGGLRPGEDAYWSGGLWIIEADTRADAAGLCEEDPFFVHGLRKGYQLFIWGRAPCYGELGSIRL